MCVRVCACECVRVEVWECVCVCVHVCTLDGASELKTDFKQRVHSCIWQ